MHRAWAGGLVGDSLAVDAPEVYNAPMRIIALRTLRDFWEAHPDARQALQAWYHDTRNVTWRGPSGIKATYRNASILGSNRVVFNIKGNQYRLVVAVHYDREMVYIRFVGSHQEYDSIDAATV